MKSPIFIFSMPRSGSTLLQRIMMTHKDIASIAEPWLLLPFVYAYKKNGILTEYNHSVSFAAIEDFIDNLPNKEEEYYQALNVFATTLYERQCLNNEKYFLDKTPRYIYIINYIEKIFPNAKFIFLFRNPVHIMSSMMNTWSNGGFKMMYEYHTDLSYGFEKLSEGYELLKGKSYAIQYEEFVNAPQKYTKEICEYLEIEYHERMIHDFANQDTKGRMGDPTGIKEYKVIENKSLIKWEKTFNTYFRKRYIKRYIESFDENCLRVQGYQKQDILKSIEQLEANHKNGFKDGVELLYSNLIRIVKPGIWFGKPAKQWSRDRFLS